MTDADFGSKENAAATAADAEAMARALVSSMLNDGSSIGPFGPATEDLATSIAIDIARPLSSDPVVAAAELQQRAFRVSVVVGCVAQIAVSLILELEKRGIDLSEVRQQLAASPYLLPDIEDPEL